MSDAKTSAKSVDVKKNETPPKTVEEKARPKATKKLANNTGEFCVYIGPSIRGVIQSGTIMTGTKEKVCAFYAPAIKNYPLIASLIVMGDTLPVDRIKVRTPGNLLYVNYMKLAKSN